MAVQHALMAEGVKKVRSWRQKIKFSETCSRFPGGNSRNVAEQVHPYTLPKLRIIETHNIFPDSAACAKVRRVARNYKDETPPPKNAFENH